MPAPRLRSLVDVRPGERATTLMAAGAFFLVLSSYFILRPVREAMGVQRNFDDLYWLWIATLLGMVAANALYAFLASRLPKTLLATCTYRLFALSLAGFVLVLALWPSLLEQHFATVPWVGQPIMVGHVFYVWLSVFNLFAVSLFWAQAADRFDLAQSKRLFPLLGAGGTLGAVTGSLITTRLAQSIEPVWLMAGSLILWRGAIALSQHAFRDTHANTPRLQTTPATVTQPPSPRLSPTRALARVVTSPYLLGISGWMLALAVAASLMYFTQARIVKDQGGDLRRNILLFAQIDLFTQAATLLLQLTVTAGLFRVLGVGRMLLATPLILVLGYAALAIAPTYAVLALFQATFRAARHAIATPARESLFTVVSVEEKYVSKAALDTFVYRAGDVLGSLLFLTLDRAGAGMIVVAALVLPISIAWGTLGLWLGRRQRTLGEQRQPPNPDNAPAPRAP